MWKGKKPLTIGTKSTPPPTPPNAARIPMTNVRANKTRGHTHQAIVLAANSAEVASLACMMPGSNKSKRLSGARTRRSETGTDELTARRYPLTVPCVDAGPSGWLLETRTSRGVAGLLTRPPLRVAQQIVTNGTIQPYAR
jgi:hypothetical protein